MDGVDNPWLPLAAGTFWTYDVTGGVATRLEVRVEEDREVVAGVSCVVVLPDDDRPRRRSHVCAGSRLLRPGPPGNVWLFGEEVEQVHATGEPASPFWRAGELGAEAGIAMLASPRVGDGYVHGIATDTADRATILSVDEERSVPAGTFGAVLMTEDESMLPYDAPVVRRYYAEGVGLVEETTVSGGSQRLLLRSVTDPTAG